MLSPESIVTRVAVALDEREVRSGCLAAAMLAKLLIERFTSARVELVRGYVTMETRYWGHFWLETSGAVEVKRLDPGSQLWFIQLPRDQKRLMLLRRLTTDRPASKTCMDSPGFADLQDACFADCQRGLFWENLRKVAGPDVERGMRQLHATLERELAS